MTEQQTRLRHEPETIPLNVYRPKEPLKAKCIENSKLCAEDSPNDVRHLVYEFEGGPYPYLDGQSAGVLPPGEDDNGKPHKLRLYSIASPSEGDDGNHKTISFCVKRLVYTCPDTGEEKRGVCSNYLCDMAVGETIHLTGPTGKTFLMPPVENANIIMLATGTGIAPFRAFLHTRYTHRVDETGESWMFLGVQTRKDYLYEDLLESYKKHDSYKLVTAFSREEKNPEGGRMYIQHRVMEHKDALFALLQQPNTYVYMCGLRGMEDGIIQAFEEAAKQKGIDWEPFFAQLKGEHRWHIEVY